MRNGRYGEDKLGKEDTTGSGKLRSKCVDQRVVDERKGARKTDRERRREKEEVGEK